MQDMMATCRDMACVDNDVNITLVDSTTVLQTMNAKDC